MGVFGEEVDGEGMYVLWDGGFGGWWVVGIAWFADATEKGRLAI